MTDQRVGLGIGEREVRIEALEAGVAGGVGAKRGEAPDANQTAAVEQAPLRLQHPRPGVARLPHPPVAAEGEVRPPVDARGTREPRLERTGGAGEIGGRRAGIGVEARPVAAPTPRAPRPSARVRYPDGRH